ncbi:MAG: GNAT family N-acetyltransferase [Anaerolineae bacterium]|jgi:ribosomal protein S18 acetylase RimI-like enzyme|nr:GNAT family N-acetyltransferase [Anaerolineae bacterium]
MTEVHPSLSFRNLRDERDYPLLLELNRSSRQAEGAEYSGAEYSGAETSGAETSRPDSITLEAIAQTLANMDGLSAQQGVIVAAQAGEAIGYSRLGWYSSYVRPQWRGRGLAGALIAHSLQLLKTQGATEVELGVDAENESAAFRLYERLGYRTYSVDTWYRKRMVD